MRILKQIMVKLVMKIMMVIAMVMLNADGGGNSCGDVDYGEKHIW